MFVSCKRLTKFHRRIKPRSVLQTFLAKNIICQFWNIFRILEDRKSHYEPSIPGVTVDVDELDDHDLYVPHFQRVSISGEDTSGVGILFFENFIKDVFHLNSYTILYV